jgi:pyroglutamyl-peptidase
MVKILFTGFEPFGGSDRNPSADAVAALPDALGGGDVRIVRAVLPVSYRRAADGLAAAIGRFAPDAVVCCGLAAGRRAVTPEWGAINVDDTAAPDNDGVVLRRTVIDPVGPAALRTPLDPYAVADAINSACAMNTDGDAVADAINSACVKNPDGGATALRAEVSYSAGEYVCNHTYYTLLRTGIPGIFIHIPAPVPPAVLEAAAIEVARQVREMSKAQ